MVQIRSVAFILGIILVVFGASMVLAILVSLGNDGEDWRALALASATTIFAGGMLALAGWTGGKVHLGRREAFLITALVWFLASLFGALPFLFSDLKMSFTDAYFETASSLTTTGSTVMTDLHKLPPGIKFWRMFMQGFGGMGIVVLAAAMLPFLGVGGMQLMKAESSERSEKPLPRAAEIALATVAAYWGLVLACAIAYWAFGMSMFDAVTHAITTIATAGFGNYDDSFAAFKSPTLEWISVVFMTAGGLPMLAFVRVAIGRGREVLRDSQILTFLALLWLMIALTGLWLWLARGTPPGDALRLAAFNVTSIMTTTGYATADFNLWGGFAGAIMFGVMFIGGCTGSTAGGIKVMRFEILFRLGMNTMRRLVHPRRVSPVRYAGRPIGEDVIESVTVFCFVYFITFAIFSAAVAATGLDFISSVTGVAQAIGNVGPGLGEIIGPAGNFKTIPDPAKWLLAIAMILGRLEFMAILVLFTRRFWRG